MGKVVVVVAVLMVVGFLARGCDSGGEGGRNEGMAKVMCENFVEDRLKAPSSADFSGVFDTDISGSGDDYVVRGYVDAQNGFGAQIRTDWTCRVSSSDGDSWNLQDLQMS